MLNEAFWPPGLLPEDPSVGHHTRGGRFGRKRERTRPPAAAAAVVARGGVCSAKGATARACPGLAPPPAPPSPLTAAPAPQATTPSRAHLRPSCPTARASGGSGATARGRAQVRGASGARGGGGFIGAAAACTRRGAQGVEAPLRPAAPQTRARTCPPPRCRRRLRSALSAGAGQLHLAAPARRDRRRVRRELQLRRHGAGAARALLGRRAAARRARQRRRRRSVGAQHAARAAGGPDPARRGGRQRAGAV
jgi:hypothetical protein